MKVKKTRIFNFVGACMLLFSSCKTDIEQHSQLKPNAFRVSSDSSVPFSENLIFNEEGYNQFKSDLADPSTASLVKNLFEKQATDALSYTSTPFSSMYPSEALKAAASAAGTRESAMVKALALQSVAVDDTSARKQYLNKAAEILKAWAKINVPSWHRPNETALFGMYEGYSLLRDSFSQADRDTIDRWIRNRATVGSNNFTIKSAAPNNVNNWEAQRLSFLAYSAYILQDVALIDRVKSEYAAFLDVYLFPEGKTKDYNHRGALVYHSYGLWSIAPFLQAVNMFEGKEAAASFVNKTNSAEIKFEDAIRFWEPYLCGLFHDDFKNSAFSSERTGTRRGRYNPAGDVYVIDKLIAFFPKRLYPYYQLLSNNSSRFANINRYISLQNNIAPDTDPSISATVTLFRHCNYGSLSGTLGIGGYTTDKLAASGIADNDVSALKVPANRRVILYDGNFRDSLTTGGSFKVITLDNSCLTANAFNDKASSIIVINN